MYSGDCLGKKINIYKTFDIDRKPNVLLLGNGITRSKETEWPRVISDLSTNTIELEDSIPYSVQASIKTSSDDVIRHNNYYQYFNKSYKYVSHPLLERILHIEFDAILTTNYTYEIESVLCPFFRARSDEWKQKQVFHARSVANAKYIINDFYRFTHNDYMYDIWHIHGEARKKSSYILTHDEYGHLVEKILNENTEHGKNFKDNELWEYKSWIDYMINSNLYILGQGFHFSEFDLWWLLNRRFKEKKERRGETFFYSPSDGKNSDVEKALDAFGVTIRTCETSKCNGEYNYKKFYEWAVNDISSHIETI